jgi:hypothetical protein
MTLYRLKTEPVEAIQFDGTEECAREIEKWTKGKIVRVVLENGEICLQRIMGWYIGAECWIINEEGNHFTVLSNFTFHERYEPILKTGEARE